MRPRRIYKDAKTDKFFYLIEKKKVFLKIPKNVSQRQVQKVNIKNIINILKPKRIKPRKKPVNIKLQQQPINLNLIKKSESGIPYYVFKENREFRTLDDITKNKPKVEPIPVKVEPIPVKVEPVPVKVVPVPVKVVPETPVKSTPIKSLFTFRNPFSTTKILPLDEINDDDNLNIKSVESFEPIESVESFSPYLDILKREKKKNVNTNIINLFEKEGLPVPKNPDEFNIWKKKLDKQRKIRKKREQEQAGEQAGEGVDDGLYNTEIENVLKKNIRNYIPVIPFDKIHLLQNYVKNDTKKFGAIINLSTSDSDGSGENGNSLGHWVSIFVNNQDSFPTVEYFDPLVSTDIPDPLYKELHSIAKKMNPEIMFKVKSNMIQQQDNRSSNCGWFSIKFLQDRFNNIPFSKASGYDDFINDNSAIGEKDIEKFKQKYKSFI